MAKEQSVTVVFGLFNHRKGKIVETGLLDEKVKIQVEPWGEIIECQPIFGEEGKYRPVEAVKPRLRIPRREWETGNELIDLVLSFLSLIIGLAVLVAILAQGLFQASYQALPQKTTDRIAIFYGSSFVFFIMALNFLIKIWRLDYMSGISGFWLGLQFPIWVFGIYWLIKSYRGKVYPFDSEPATQGGEKK